MLRLFDLNLRLRPAIPIDLNWCSLVSFRLLHLLLSHSEYALSVRIYGGSVLLVAIIGCSTQ